MSRLVCLTAALLATAVCAQTRPETADLRIVVDHLKPVQGYVMVGVYSGKEAYDHEVRLRGERISVTADHLEVDIKGLPPGEYGLKLFHDINGNAQLDSNLLGIPTEPVAYSNNAKGTMGPASWADAHFSVGGPVTVQMIRFEGR